MARRRGRTWPVRTPSIGSEHLVEFRLELGLPVWRYELPGVAIEKRVVMPYGQNTVHITYQLVDGDGPDSDVAAAVDSVPRLRGTGQHVTGRAYTLTAAGHAIRGLGRNRDLPSLRFLINGERAALTLDEKGVPVGSVRRWSGPAATIRSARCGVRGTSVPTCRHDQPVTLVASTEPWEAIQALPPADAEQAERDRRRRLLAIAGATSSRARSAAELVLAADQFIITPAGRARRGGARQGRGRRSPHGHRRLPLVHRLGPRHDDQPRRAHARDRRYREAAYILATFGHYVRDGLIPNMFPTAPARGSITRPTRRCGSSTPCTAT